MKIWQIVENDNPTFSQGRTSSGGVIVPDDFTPKATFENVGDKGNLKAVIERADGTKVTVEGTPKEVAEALGNEQPDAKKQRYKSRWQKWKSGVLKFLSKGKFFAFLAASGLISVAQIGVLIKEYIENRSALRLMMEEEFVDSVATREIWTRSKQYLVMGIASALATEVVGAILAALAAGKVLKMIRAVRTGMLAFPGAGWVGALLTTIIVEGAVYGGSWLLNRYGPGWFANWIQSEWTSGVAEIEIAPMSSSDQAELNQQLERDVENPESDTDSSSVSRISNRLRSVTGDNAAGSNDAAGSDDFMTRFRQASGYNN